ncbi:MAG TPA: hypothetical protein VJN02_12515 [Gammaproteobacteria bacterium]|nr:hypothetical protein [Gammaproteobacteria bacterium]
MAMNRSTTTVLSTLSANQKANPTPLTKQEAALIRVISSPITGEIMANPVVSKVDGMSYERSDLEKRLNWKEGKDFYPNIRLKNIIAAITTKENGKLKLRSDWKQQQEKIVQELTDCILLKPMQNAVITPNGQSYEEQSTKQLMTKDPNQDRFVCPLTRATVKENELILNRDLSTISKLIFPMMIFKEENVDCNKILRTHDSDIEQQNRWLIQESSSDSRAVTVRTISPTNQQLLCYRYVYMQDTQEWETYKDNNELRELEKRGRELEERGILSSNALLTIEQIDKLFKKLKMDGFDEQNQILPIQFHEETKNKRYAGCTTQAFKEYIECDYDRDRKIDQNIQTFDQLRKALIASFPDPKNSKDINWKSLFGENPPSRTSEREHQKASAIFSLAREIKSIQIKLKSGEINLEEVKIRLAVFIQYAIDQTASGPQKSGVKKLFNIDTRTETALKNFLKDQGLEQYLTKKPPGGLTQDNFYDYLDKCMSSVANELQQNRSSRQPSRQ